MPWVSEVRTYENSIGYTIKLSMVAVQDTGFLLDTFSLGVLASSRFPAGTN